jgi:thioester reductase-like protein
VRGHDDGDAARRLAEAYRWHFPGRDLPARIEAVAGDLRRPRLGLGQARWDALARAAGVVLHAAADVRHVGERDEVFATNLDGTRRMLDLAAGAGAIPLLHVSTVGVAGHVPDERGDVVLTESDLDVGQRPTEAYSASKLAAEHAVRERWSAGQHGAVFRVGTVGPHSVTGRFQRNPDSHFLARYLRAAVDLGVAAAWPDRAFRLIPADVLARLILALATGADSDRRTFHLRSVHALPHIEVLGVLQDAGHPITVLDPEHYAARITELAADPRHAEGVGRALPQIDRPPGRPVRLDATWTDERLAALGLGYPVPTTTWLTRFVEALAGDYLPRGRPVPARTRGA